VSSAIENSISPTPDPAPLAGARKDATTVGFPVSGTAGLSVDVGSGNGLSTDQLLSLPGVTGSVPISLAYNSVDYGTGVICLEHPPDRGFTRRHRASNRLAKQQMRNKTGHYYRGQLKIEGLNGGSCTVATQTPNSSRRDTGRRFPYSTSVKLGCTLRIPHHFPHLSPQSPATPTTQENQRFPKCIQVSHVGLELANDLE
jgi:hypothetical protein